MVVCVCKHSLKTSYVFDHHSTELTDHGFFVNCPVFGFGFLKFSLHILKSSNTEVWPHKGVGAVRWSLLS